MANPAQRDIKLGATKHPFPPTPSCFCKNLCAGPGCSVAETQEKLQSGGSRGDVCPDADTHRAGGLWGEAGDASRSAGSAGPSMPVSLGCSPLRPHGEELRPGGRWWHRGEPGWVLGFTPAGAFPAHSHPSALALTRRPTPSHAVLRPLVSSKNNFLPVSHAGSQPSSAPHGSRGSARAGFLRKPPRTRHHPPCEGPGEFLPRVSAAKPGLGFAFWRDTGVVFAFGDAGDGIAFGDDARDGFALGGHGGWCWFWQGTPWTALETQGPGLHLANTRVGFGLRGAGGGGVFEGMQRLASPFWGGLEDGLPRLAAAVPAQAGLRGPRCPAGSSAGWEAVV